MSMLDSFHDKVSNLHLTQTCGTHLAIIPMWHAQRRSWCSSSGRTRKASRTLRNWLLLTDKTHHLTCKKAQPALYNQHASRPDVARVRHDGMQCFSLLKMADNQRPTRRIKCMHASPLLYLHEQWAPARAMGIAASA